MRLEKSLKLVSAGVIEKEITEQGKLNKGSETKLMTLAHRQFWYTEKLRYIVRSHTDIESNTDIFGTSVYLTLLVPS